MIDIKKNKGFIVSYQAFILIFEKFVKNLEDDAFDFSEISFFPKLVVIEEKIKDIIHFCVEFHYFKNEEDEVHKNNYIEVIINRKEIIDPSVGCNRPQVAVILTDKLLRYVFKTFLGNPDFEDILALIAIHFLIRHDCEIIENLLR